MIRNYGVVEVAVLVAVSMTTGSMTGVDEAVVSTTGGVEVP